MLYAVLPNIFSQGHFGHCFCLFLLFFNILQHNYFTHANTCIMVSYIHYLLFPQEGQIIQSDTITLEIPKSSALKCNVLFFHFLDNTISDSVDSCTFHCHLQHESYYRLPPLSHFNWHLRFFTSV